ncbi:alpha/beta-hydrolase [Lentithecium fluviatile CBS 122367]|uniref:Carboxylic ester hydrolase n=1 Tax=Lentithecium fluviatile CBS 122367 TaxID=1168545 RepID=A0A6G1J7Y6_9PLEO|nr:alpha/beta-hydrolase [Lentithecium fluviatile CBS 122367]
MVAAGIVIYFIVLIGFKKSRTGPRLEVPETPLVVTLPGYGTFEGIDIINEQDEKILHHKQINSFLSVEYSVQPVKENRFAPPNWPRKFEGTKEVKEYGPACMQNYGFDSGWHKENCLTFNLYRPAGVPYSKKLPVFIFLHGGGFVGGSARSFDGPLFVGRSKEPLIVVTMQYRLGAMGSLPSKLFAEQGLLNLGIRDQRMLLKFMQTYLQYFGGDPDRVTLGGQSAGAHSVGIHLFHNYGDDTNRRLFSQAIIASGAPTARSFPPHTYPLYQDQFRRFMGMLGCEVPSNKSSGSAEAMSCLRDVSLGELQHASSVIFKETKYNITWPWQPVSPGPLLEKYGSVSGKDGTFYKIPTLISSCTDEGKFFAPKNLTTNDDFLKFMKNLLPGLTQQDLKDLEELYPDPSEGESPYADSPESPQFNRVSAAYGDYSYICPVQETAQRLAAKDVPVYKARFNTPNGDDGPMGVPHASDAQFFNGNPHVRHPHISDIYSAYYSSFIVNGDPNSHKTKDSPKWERYEHLGGKELKVSNEERGGVHVENESDGIRMRQCGWWRDEERMLRAYK